METQANYTRVGFFVLFGFIGIMVTALWLSQINFTTHFMEYDIFFKGSVTGLNEGSLVQYRGVPIGTVKKIRISHHDVEQIRVMVEIDAKVPIKADAIASIETQGLTGVSYIQINGSTPNSPPLTVLKGQARPIIPSKSSLLEQVSTTLPQIMQEVHKLTQSLTDLLNKKNQEKFSQILDNVERLTGLFSPQKGQELSFFKEMDDAMDQVLKTVKDIRLTSQEMRGLLKENRENLKNFTTQGLSQLAKVLAEGQQTFQGIQQLSEAFAQSPLTFLFPNSNQGVPTE